MGGKLRLLAVSLSNEPTGNTASFESQWKQGLKTDIFPQQVLSIIHDSTLTSTESNLSDCSNSQGQLRFCEPLYVPDYAPLKLEILQHHHYLPLAGQLGTAKTLVLIACEYV